MPLVRKPAPSVLTSGALTPQPGRVPRPVLSLPPSQEILFYAWTVDGTEPTSQEDLFGVMPRSGVVRRLTNEATSPDAASDRDPDWSPSHSRIVSMRATFADPSYLTVRDSAGTVVRTIAVSGTEPIWMNARRILTGQEGFSAGGERNRADIVGIGMTGLVRHVTAALPGEFLSAPDWHPIAGLVATLTREDPVTHESLGSQLVRATAAAVTTAITTGTPIPVTAMTRIGATDTWNGFPSWSPDGASIAYVTLRPCASVEAGAPIKQPEIAIMSTIPRVRPRLVTDDSAGRYEDGLSDGSPVFSPDGQWLAWCRGYEDTWSQIVLQKLSNPSTRRILVADTHWWRGGLSW